MNKAVIKLCQIFFCATAWLASVIVTLFGFVLWFYVGFRVLGFIVLVIGFMSSSVAVYLWGVRKHV